MQGRSVSNGQWSIGKLVDIFGYKLIEEDGVNAIFIQLCDRMLCVVDNMNAQEISNSLWAMGKLKYKRNKYIKALVEAAYKQSDIFPQGTSNMLGVSYSAV
eukprot:TRINITY_DN6659_c0_g1_i1.p2 TRINITY_DN6659_c0_g1~~TRINITY_DN6659_c0_g1_i1.p2  ORF type:complete len:101 (+),score=11.38 TRINITY_DN6659_c0_g1_i1:1-303(+)